MNATILVPTGPHSSHVWPVERTLLTSLVDELSNSAIQPPAGLKYVLAQFPDPDGD
jgi:hypothetical protein